MPPYYSENLITWVEIQEQELFKLVMIHLQM